MEGLECRLLLSAALDYGDYFWADGERVPLLRVMDESSGDHEQSTAVVVTGPQSGWVSSLPHVDPRATIFQVAGSASQVQLTREVYVALNSADTAELLTASRGFASFVPVPGAQNEYVATVSGGAAASLMAANALTQTPGVRFAHPNFVVEVQTALSDPLFSSQWNLHNTGQSGGSKDADIDAPEAWETTTGSPDVVVAILDVGVQLDHPDLVDNIFRNSGEIPDNGIDDDGNGWIDDYHGLDLSFDNAGTARIEYDGDPSPNNSYDNHGTAVAGVVAGAAGNGIGIQGVAPGVKLLPIKIGTSNSAGGFSTTVASLAAAVYYAAGRTADGSGTWRGADVANHSYSIGVPADALTQAFQWAATNGRNGRGLTSFVSSGNGGYNSVSYPANLASTIAVGATDHRDLRTTYSQYGSGLDFVAPGGGGGSGGWIWTTDRSGNDGYLPGDYTGITGTSFSAPTAAGIAALMLSVDPDLTAADVREILRDTADRDKVPGVTFNALHWNSQYGYGWLNAASAVEAVLERDGGPPSNERGGGPAPGANVDIIGRQDSSGLWWAGVSNGSTFTWQPWAAWSAGADWTDFVSGDFNGDGRTDVSARDGKTGNIWVGLSTGRGLTTQIWGTWSTTVDLSTALVGDFDADGRSDLAVRVQEAGDGRWYVARSTGSSFVTTVWGGLTTIKQWGQFQTGDFDGDGRTDIGARIQDAGDGRWVVLQSTGSRFSGAIWGAWSTFVGWNVFTGDIDGDGRSDLIARTGNPGDGRWFISRSTGKRFENRPWGRVVPQLALATVLIDDFTGDGRDDIAIWSPTVGNWQVLRSGGTASITEDWGNWSSKSLANLVAGDFDGNGVADIAGRDEATGAWQVALSTTYAFESHVWGRSNGGTWAFAASGDIG